MFWQFLQHNHICQDFWKNIRSTFECMVVFKSRGQGPKKIENYGTNMSRTLNKNLDLVPWIGEKSYTQMLIWYFSNNLDIYEYVGKLPEQHFSLWLFSNQGDKLIFLLKSNEARISEWNSQPYATSQ